MAAFEFLGSLDASEYAEMQQLLAEPWPVDSDAEVQYSNAAAFEEENMIEDADVVIS